MSVNFIFQPNPGPQELFMRHPAEIVGYGGSAGSGKSLGLRFHPFYLLDFEDQRYRRGEIKHSSAAVVYFRRIMPNLRQAIAASHREFKLIDKEARWKEQDHTWTFECGMTYMFGALERVVDWQKFYSFEFQGIYWDELTEFEEEQFDQLSSRLRTPDPLLTRFLNIRWGSNPAGPGLVWVRRRFVDAGPVGQTLRVKTKTSNGLEISRDQVFIQAYLSDNPSLYKDGRYEAALRRNKPHIFKALFEGNWHYNPGGLLANVWNNELHVIPNHAVPPNTFHFRSCDFGINNHTSITWWYVDRDGVMTAYYNLYVKDLTVDKLCPRIREIEKYFCDWDTEADKSMLRRSPLDASCWGRNPINARGPSIADEFRRQGIMWIPSIKDRLNSISELMRRLSQTVPTGMNDSMGRPIVKPMIRWMKRCEAPIRILPIIPSDPNNLDDISPDFKEDDVLDEVRYAVSAYPLTPQGPKIVKDEDDLYDDEDNEQRRRNSRGFAQLAG